MKNIALIVGFVGLLMTSIGCAAMVGDVPRESKNISVQIIKLYKNHPCLSTLSISTVLFILLYRYCPSFKEFIDTAIGLDIPSINDSNVLPVQQIDEVDPENHDPEEPPLEQSEEKEAEIL